MSKTGAIKNKNNTSIEKQNRDSIERGDSGYVDPETGYYVFNSDYLYNMGMCCGNDCRHCPWALPSALKS